MLFRGLLILIFIRLMEFLNESACILVTLLGIVIDVNAVQLPNDRSPMIVGPFEISTFTRDVHPKNIPYDISLRVDGIYADSNESPYCTSQPPIFSRPSGRTISFKALFCDSPPVSISLIVDGRVIDSSELRPDIAIYSIFNRPSGSINDLIIYSMSNVDISSGSKG